MDEVVRQLDPFHDFGPLALLLSSVLPEPVTVEHLQLFEQLPLPPWRRMVAMRDGEQLIGYSAIIHTDPGRTPLFDLWLTTHSDYRRQGMGSLLFREAITF